MLTAHHNKAAEPSTNLSENSVIKNIMYASEYHLVGSVSV
jgi:hypothetical protein